MSARTTYGLLRVGDAAVALPLTVLREVIPCPKKLAPIPARARGLLGAVNLRDVVIPVLDLAVTLEWPERVREHPVIVIISSGGRTLGVVADRVDGITTVPDDQRHDTRDTADGLVFSHTFGHPETGSVVSILDAGAILGLPGVPAVLDPADGPAGAAPVTASAVPAGLPMLLVRCGEFRLAVRLTDIHTVLPQLVVTDSPLAGDLCRGVTAYLRDWVPVVDLAHGLGLGPPTGDQGAQGLLWSYPDGLVALQVSEVVQIVTLDPARIHPLPALGGPNAGRFSGAVLIEGHGQHLVVDSAALSADETLTALGRLTTPREDVVERDDRPAGGSTTGLGRYLTYRAGVEVATPLTQIAEILAYPDDVAPLAGAGGGLLGLFTHRESVVSLISLNELIGRPREIDPVTSRVLLVEQGGHHIGYVVDDLGAIELSVWEQDDEGGGTTPGRIEDSRLVQLGADPDGRLVPRVDLAGWAAALGGG
ncbi:chemotaxis protein CheW [Actinoplanes sp. M2I2]|uniref:chemotaxis protein CheW n=1 Tax=Actinoplanes sp. M2I2 TaxID=1734444 RepID=UPI0020211E86|nr:chemotaxis protein CheW [Actinoplanes sp. M2I2]